MEISTFYSKSERRSIKTIYDCQVTISRVETITNMATNSSTNLTTNSVSDLKIIVSTLLATKVSPSCTRDQVDTLSTASGTITVSTHHVEYCLLDAIFAIYIIYFYFEQRFFLLSIVIHLNRNQQPLPLHLLFDLIDILD